MTKSADILAALAEAPCTAPEIARRLGMDPDAVSATLCVLQRGGRAVRLRGRVRMAGPIPVVRWSLPGPEDIEVALAETRRAAAGPRDDLRRDADGVGVRRSAERLFRARPEGRAMPPADIVVRWPSAEEIARAAFAAAKAEGCDAIAMLNGAGAPFDGTRVARLYAVIALAQQYPTAPRADLSRRLGCKKAAHDARAYLRQGKWRTFSLDRLNAVRAACGWAAMTGEEAFAAPMTLCGRHWTEFVALRCDDGMSPAAAPLGGSGAENELPPIQDSTLGGEPFPLCGSPSENGVGAGDCAEKAPANIQSSDGRAEGGLCKSELGALRDAPCQLASAKDAAKSSSADPLKSNEEKVDSAPGPAHLQAHRTSADPITKTGKAAYGASTASDDISLLIPNDISRTQFLPRRSVAEQSSADPARFAAKQKSRAITTITQDPSMSGGSAKSIISKSTEREAIEPVVEPGPSDAGISRLGAQNGGFEARKGGLAKEIKPRAVAPSDGFSALRAAALSGGTVSFRKADPPPEKRGVVLKTAELMGDPTPEQRARMAATPGQAVRTQARWR